MSKIDMVEMKFEKEKIKTMLLVFSGAIMIAHGMRMIYQGLFQPHSYYQPGLFDILFDWTTLIILGICIFYFGITGFYQQSFLKNQKTIHIH